MITAGPTYEKIDPVRFIGNYSSGKMGIALADECARRGAEVTLIAGPIPLRTSYAGIHRIDVESCEEMYHAATGCFAQQDAAILCAAVADYKPITTAQEKIKRTKEDLTITLTHTEDIAAALGKEKKQSQVMVGFALETCNEEANAQGKLQRKNLDFIVLNSLRNEGTCFRSNENQITIITKNGKTEYEKKDKNAVACDIIDQLYKQLLEKKQQNE